MESIGVVAPAKQSLHLDTPVHFEHFKLPIMDPELLGKWVAALKRDVQPGSTAVLLNAHFQVADFIERPQANLEDLFPTLRAT